MGIWSSLFFVMFVCLPFSWLWLTPSDLKDFGESLIFVFLIPLYILIFNFKKKYVLNYLNIFIIIIIISWFVKNLVVSGCLIYPVEITCLEKLQWFSNDSNYLVSAKAQSLDNEAWTKGWSNYNGSGVSQEYYVKNFFWLKTWFSIHGLLILKKLSIFILILFIINFYLKKFIEFFVRPRFTII